MSVGGDEDAAYSLKNWITPEYSDVEVAPKQQITLNFSIDVPAKADPGDHWGTLVAFSMPQGGGAGVGINAGLGFIIYVRVPGEVREKLAIESFSVPRFADSLQIPVEARFQNVGTVHEAPTGFIEIRNIFGALVATGTLPVRNVLPGAVRMVDAHVGGDGFWLGRYTVLLYAHYGDSGSLLTASARIWIVPWKEYGAWFLVGISVLGFLIWRRKRLPAFWHILRYGVPPPNAGG